MYQLAAQTFQGLEGCLAKEIENLGGKQIVQGRRVVTFTGDLEVVYKVNVWCRTALNVVINLANGKISGKEDLYQMAKEIPWEDYFAVQRSIAVGGAVRSTKFRDSQFPFLVVKDAIADRFREKTGARPNVRKENPDIRIHIRVGEHDATISLDSSGEPLFKRGYRAMTNNAPMNEVLAAGMILLSGWDASKTFVDPMCGSGTLPIEAAMIAHGIPPGYNRERFGFSRWRNFDKSLFEQVKEYTLKPLKPEVRIMGADIQGTTVRKARLNHANLPEGTRIEWVISDITDFDAPENPGVLIVNPPYGERMRMSDIEMLYRSIGNSFKQRFKNWDCWVLSHNREAFRFIALSAGERHILYNGPLECDYRRFSMWEGSEKYKNMPKEEFVERKSNGEKKRFYKSKPGKR
jgi:putative N6-adenine-specific DNA methylase